MLKTLLVDDNEDFRLSLRSLLSRNFPFMQIVEAATGASALLHGSGCQLVFMDIRLPDTNGLEITRRLKSSQPNSQVCVVTQYDIPEYRDAANQSGATEFIRKDTLNEATIVSLVDSMLKIKEKVLIVEDDKKFREFLCRLFADCWPEVIVADTAWPVIGVAATGLNPDLIVLELHSGTEGLDQLASVMSKFNTTAMILVASPDWPEHQEWARRYGLRACVFKDEHLFDELLATIGAQLHQTQPACKIRTWPKGRSSPRLR